MLSVGHNLHVFMLCLHIPASTLGHALGRSNPTLIMQSLKSSCNSETLFDVERITQIPLAIWTLPTDYFVTAFAHGHILPKDTSPLVVTARERSAASPHQIGPPLVRPSPSVVPAVAEALQEPPPEWLTVFVREAMSGFSDYWFYDWNERRGRKDLDSEGYPRPVGKAVMTASGKDRSNLAAVCHNYQLNVEGRRRVNQAPPPVPYELVFETKRSNEILLSDLLSQRMVWYARYKHGTETPPEFWSAGLHPQYDVGITDGPSFPMPGRKTRVNKKASKPQREKEHPTGVVVDSDGRLTIDEQLVKIWLANDPDVDVYVKAYKTFGYLAGEDRNRVARSADAVAARIRAAQATYHVESHPMPAERDRYASGPMQPTPEPLPTSHPENNYPRPEPQPSTTETAAAPSADPRAPRWDEDRGKWVIVPQEGWPHGGWYNEATQQWVPMQMTMPSREDTGKKSVDTAPKGEHTEDYEVDEHGNRVIPEDQLSPLERETGARPMSYDKLRETMRKLEGE